MTIKKAPPPTIRVGSKWREVDRRFPNLPVRQVTGFTPEGRVLLAMADGKRAAKSCDPKRFHGRSGGYELVEDAP